MNEKISGTYLSFEFGLEFLAASMKRHKILKEKIYAQKHVKTDIKP